MFSLFMLFLALVYAQTPNPLFILLWVLIGGFSLYKLCATPSRAS